MKKETKTIIALIILVLLLGMAGNHDWAEEVLESVPTELYQTIRSDIGGDPSDVKIARHYLDNRTHYDSIAQSYGW